MKRKPPIHMLLVACLALCCINLQEIQAQLCGTVLTPENKVFMDSAREARRGLEFSQLSTTIAYYPIRYHVTRTSSGTGGITTAELDAMLAIINDRYLPANMQFFQCGPINYIDDNFFYNFDYFDDALLGSTYDEPNLINMYFMNSVSYGSGGLCGYAYYPGGPDRIVMANSCANNGSTPAHELGHYMSLIHTHGPSNSTLTTELVNGSNCSFTGDRICDTPADPQLSYSTVSGSCIYTGSTTDANGDAFAPNPRNIMSYSRKECRDFFSAGQLNETALSGMFDRSYLNCSSCPVTLSFVSAISTGTYEAVNQINSSGTVSAGSAVSFVAGTEVNLLPGFESQAGSDFEARIQACSSAAARQKLIVENQQQLHTYPNPAAGSFFISVPLEQEQRGSIKLIDLSGAERLVLDGQIFTAGENNLEVSLKELPDGIYICLINLPDQAFATKVIVAQQ